MSRNTSYTKFLGLGALEGESTDDGTIICATLQEYGWDPDHQDPYAFVADMDEFTQVSIIQQLFIEFKSLNSRDQDTAFGMFIWCTNDDAFVRLVSSANAVQTVIYGVFSDQAALVSTLEQFGCASPALKKRIHHCWDCVTNDFHITEEP